MSAFDVFLEKLVLHGLEMFRVYYGIYRAQVVRNDDPEERGRIQILCPSAGHTRSPDVWVDPSFDGAGDDRGSFWPPEVGDSVRIAFENGRPERPIIYWGGWHGEAEVPSELGYSGKKPGKKPTRRGWVTRIGHTLIVNDASGEESIELVWRKPSQYPSDAKKTAARDGDSARLKFAKDGSVLIENKSGTTLSLDATGKKAELKDEHGNTLTMEDGAITLSCSGTVTVADAKKVVLEGAQVVVGKDGSEAAVLGDTYSQIYMTHTHGCAVGTTTPPTNASQMQQALSKSVKVRR